MVIGVLEITLRLYGVSSLKDKRSLIKPLLSHLRKKFNVSVIESGAQDNWHRSEVAVACVTANAALAHAQLEQILSLVAREANMEIIDTTLEIL